MGLHQDVWNYPENPPGGHPQTQALWTEVAVLRQGLWWCFNTLILCRPLLLLPSIFPSIRVFSNESVLCIRWPKYWSFSFNISPSHEHPGPCPNHLALLPSALLQTPDGGAMKRLVSPHWLTSAQQCAGAFCLKAPDIRIPFLDIYPKETFPQECIVGGSKMLSTIYKGKQI